MEILKHKRDIVLGSCRKVRDTESFEPYTHSIEVNSFDLSKLVDEFWVIVLVDVKAGNELNRFEDLTAFRVVIFIVIQVWAEHDIGVFATLYLAWILHFFLFSEQFP